MLHGDLLTPRIRDNKNPICKKKDLEIFCSLLNVEVSDYYRFIAKLWNTNKKRFYWRLKFYFEGISASKHNWLIFSSDPFVLRIFTFVKGFGFWCVDRKYWIKFRLVNFIAKAIHVGSKLKDSHGFLCRAAEPSHMVQSGHSIAGWKAEWLNFDVIEILDRGSNAHAMLRLRKHKKMF